MRKYVSAVRISIHHGIRSRKRVGGGRLEGSYVPPKEPRVLRGLTRYRVKLVEHQNISPPSRAGYRNYLNDATSSWLPLPATFWASVVRAMPHGQCRRIVSRRPSDASQPMLVEEPSGCATMHCLLPSKRSDLLIFPSFTP